MVVEPEPVDAVLVNLRLVGKGDDLALAAVVVDVVPVVLDLLLDVAGSFCRLLAKQPVPEAAFKPRVVGVVVVLVAAVVGRAVGQTVHVGEVGGVGGDGLEGRQLRGVLDLERVVGRKPAGLRMVDATDLVGHGLVQGVEHLARAGGHVGAGRHHAAEVHHVGVALEPVVAAVVVSLADRARHRGQRLLVGSRGVHLLREVVEVLDELVHQRKVHHRQGREALAVLVDRGKVAVADRAAELLRAACGVLRQMLDDGAVFPARPRLALLRGNHVLGVGGQHVGRLEGTHQAGVEADELEGLPHAGIAGRQRGVELAQAQRVVVVALVKAHARDAAAAVIPQDEPHVFGGVVGDAPGEEVGEGLRVSHVGGRHAVHLHDRTVADEVAAQLAGIDVA